MKKNIYYHENLGFIGDAKAVAMKFKVSIEQVRDSGLIRNNKLLANKDWIIAIKEGEIEPDFNILTRPLTTNQKISRSKINLYSDEAERLKLSNSIKKGMKDSNASEKISKIKKEYFSNPKNKESLKEKYYKHSEKMKERYSKVENRKKTSIATKLGFTQEVRKRISNIQLKRFKNPIERDKLSLSQRNSYLNNPERAIKQSVIMKKVHFQNPILAENHSLLMKEKWDVKMQERYEQLQKYFSVKYNYHVYDLEKKLFYLNLAAEESSILLELPDSMDISQIKETVYKDRFWVKSTLIEEGIFNENIFELNKIPTKNYFKSKAEVEIKDFLESKGIQVQTSNRKILEGLEIDLFLPKHNIGIEFNGIYWHNDKIKMGSRYHQKKSLLASYKGIFLIQIFEHQYIFNKEKCLNFILDKVASPEKIYARKCTVKPIENKLANLFEESYHMQNSTIASLKLGLFYNEELVSVASFTNNIGSNTTRKNDFWLLDRLTFKQGCKVTGGASKLLSFFEKNYYPKYLISYANLQWSQGKVYEKLGFKVNKSYSKPSYWWFKGKKIYFRTQTSKKNLPKILGRGFLGMEFSESTNMRENGFLRTWDCGTIVYIKKYN